MANLSPKCKLCGVMMVFIGIAGGAEPACPKDCSACTACKHPKAELKLIAAEIVQRDEPAAGAWLYFTPSVTKRYYVTTSECSKCGVASTSERPVP